MKKHILSTLLPALLLLGLCTACETEFLEKQPIIGTTEGNFYQTEADAIAAVNAAYAALQFEMTPCGHFRWFWGDIMSDDSEKGGSGPNDVFELTQLETFQGTANTALLACEWKADYQGIYRANVVLEKVPGIKMDERLKSRILGEARFIRAWFFYNLVTLFGGVPKADHVLAPSEFNMPRATEAEIWDLIEQDLQQAIPDLWLRSEYPLEDLGRITRGAAQALLARVYLWRQNWQAAKEMTEAVINSGEYFLEPDFSNIFTLAGENGPGSVFEIQYMPNSGGNWGENNANEGTFTNVFQRARGQFEGYGFNIPTQSLVDEFFKENPNIEDPRLKYTIFREGDAMGDRGIFTKEATGYPHDYYPRKYFLNKSEEASFGDPNPNGASNDRVIRYAEVLLMHAEAAYHLGDEEAARQSLNQVRRRARGSAPPYVLPDRSSSGPELLEDIYHERRLELALEGHRFFDLVRTGRAAQVLGPLGYKEEVHRLFPIPESQIQATNGALTQNPGY
ncbi:MAG: RagB/SusD family nutrient uptake outer membrane protein [Bacteroidetes bacterium]|nr:MAG: RagB/SusD family nutrient uptake outer membrane protein [Bacteroidota bacterium]